VSSIAPSRASDIRNEDPMHVPDGPSHKTSSPLSTPRRRLLGLEGLSIALTLHFDSSLCIAIVRLHVIYVPMPKVAFRRYSYALSSHRYEPWVNPGAEYHLVVILPGHGSAEYHMITNPTRRCTHVEQSTITTRESVIGTVAEQKWLLPRVGWRHNPFVSTMHLCHCTPPGLIPSL
jgi:hypothetical protein